MFWHVLTALFVSSLIEVVEARVGTVKAWHACGATRRLAVEKVGSQGVKGTWVLPLLDDSSGWYFWADHPAQQNSKNFNQFNTIIIDNLHNCVFFESNSVWNISSKKPRSFGWVWDLLTSISCALRLNFCELLAQFLCFCQHWHRPRYCGRRKRRLCWLSTFTAVFGRYSCPPGSTGYALSCFLLGQGHQASGLRAEANKHQRPGLVSAQCFHTSSPWAFWPFVWMVTFMVTWQPDFKLVICIGKLFLWFF